MTWYIVRHAEKEAGDFYHPGLPHPDQPLSRQGQQSAGKLADYFAEKPLQAIYISAYQRTGQTVVPLARQRRLKPIIDSRLNEIDSGRVAAMTGPEFRESYPDVWAACNERKTDFRFPGGETLGEAQCRIADFLTEKRQQHTDSDVY